MKFHLGQKVRIWGRNLGEVIGLPSNYPSEDQVYTVEWDGYYKKLSAEFRESELEEA
jgi:predicted phage tail protein